MAAALLVASAAPAAAQSPGNVNFELAADSSFDSILTSATSAQRSWMNVHYTRMRGYAPFFTQALSWAPPASFYKDLYALYRGDAGDQLLMNQHPNWVLRDAQGNRLFIQYDCDGTTCTQYAADIGSPEWRAHWIADARATMNDGYSGLFVDDVNLEMRVSNGAGNFVRPVDPRTGQPMTDADWRRYMAEFTEQIRAAFPGKEITHNSLWWMDRGDPYVQRQVAAADQIEVERGFADTGIGGGGGQWGFETYLGYMDWVHSKGAGVTLEAYNLNSTSSMFELASYFLVSNGADRIASHYRSFPDNWWSGWDTDLGTPSGGRYSWQGLLRRDFNGGIALVNQPGAATRTVQLPSGVEWRNLDGNVVTSVTLGAREGTVLKSSSTPPPQDPPTSDPAPTSGDTVTAPTIKVNRKKVKSGRKLILSGQASAASVEVRAYIGGAWQAVAADESLSDGDYSVRLKATSPGVVEFKATAPGLPESDTVSVKIKN